MCFPSFVTLALEQNQVDFGREFPLPREVFRAWIYRRTVLCQEASKVILPHDQEVTDVYYRFLSIVSLHIAGIIYDALFIAGVVLVRRW